MTTYTQLAGRRLVLDPRAGARPEQRSTQRRVGAHHVEVTVLLLQVPDEVALGHAVVVALVDDGHDRAGETIPSSSALDDLGGLDDVLELADAAFHVALLVLRRVVVAVLAEVAQQSGRLDLLGDLDPTPGGEVVELGLQPFECGAGELGRRHSGKTLPPRNISGHGLSDCSDRRRRHRPRGDGRGAEGRARCRDRSRHHGLRPRRRALPARRRDPVGFDPRRAARLRRHPARRRRHARGSARCHRARPAAEDAVRPRPVRQPETVRRHGAGPHASPTTSS